MSDGYYGIEDAHAKACDWDLEPLNAASQLWNGFSSWLARGDRIY
jgi:hypothetical protein